MRGGHDLLGTIHVGVAGLVEASHISVKDTLILDEELAVGNSGGDLLREGQGDLVVLQVVGDFGQLRGE